MEDQKSILKSINENILKLSKKSYSTDIDFVSKETQMKAHFVKPIDIGEAEIGFKALYTYYSIPNVSKENNNNVFKFKVVNDEYTISFPDGAYEITQINEHIQDFMKENFFYNAIRKATESDNAPEIVIRPVDSTGHSVIEIPDNCEVNFSVDNSIGSLLGFSRKKSGVDNILGPGIHYSDNLVNIIPVNSISVCVKVNGLDVYGSVVNGDVSNRIYTFFPDVEPGEKINEVADNKMFYPIERVSKIQNITVYLTNQDGKPIDNSGEIITLILTLKYTE